MKPRLHHFAPWLFAPRLFTPLLLWLLVLVTAVGGVLPVAAAVVRTACSCPIQSEEQPPEQPAEHGCESSGEAVKKAVHRRTRHLVRWVVHEERVLWTHVEAAERAAVPRRPDGPDPVLQELLSASLGLRAPPATS